MISFEERALESGWYTGLHRAASIIPRKELLNYGYLTRLISSQMRRNRAQRRHWPQLPLILLSKMRLAKFLLDGKHFIITDLTPQEISPPCSTNLSVANSTATDPPSAINSPRAQLQSNASMEATIAIIPHRTSSSIKKYFVESQAKASIQMTFPLRPIQLPCSIIFEVEGNIIEDIASALFGVVVKSDKEMRYLYYPGGTEVFAHKGRFKLRNGKKKAMAELFSPEIAIAVETSPLFQTDKEQDRIKCISMSISNDPRQAAFLSLSLSLAKGTLISAKLYL